MKKHAQFALGIVFGVVMMFAVNTASAATSLTFTISDANAARVLAAFQGQYQQGQGESNGAFMKRVIAGSFIAPTVENWERRQARQAADATVTVGTAADFGG